MGSGRRLVLAAVVAVAVALAPPGVASADNSNNNTNNNDVTNLGDPSDMSAPSNESTSWPPADLSWPPRDNTNSGENGGSAATPIVMPTGGPAQTEAATASTSDAANPIVPVTTP